jgi:hypothetical protein
MYFFATLMFGFNLRVKKYIALTCMAFDRFLIMCTSWRKLLVITLVKHSELYWVYCAPLVLLRLLKSQSLPDWGYRNFHWLYQCRAKGHRTMSNQVGSWYNAIFWTAGSRISQMSSVIHWQGHQSPHHCSQLDLQLILGWALSSPEDICPWCPLLLLGLYILSLSGPPTRVPERFSHPHSNRRPFNWVLYCRKTSPEQQITLLGPVVQEEFSLSQDPDDRKTLATSCLLLAGSTKLSPLLWLDPQQLQPSLQVLKGSLPHFGCFC